MLTLLLFSLRPNDSRMLVALGECYEKLNQLVEAKKVSEIEPLRTEWDSPAWRKGVAICAL